MKKNILFGGIIILISLFALSATAQEAMLGRAKGFLDPAKGLQIEYQLTIGEDGEQGSYYALGEAFYLEGESIKAWCDGDNLWVYLPQNREVNLTKPLKEDLLELNPLLNLNRISSNTFELKETRVGEVTSIKAVPKVREEIEWMEINLNAKGKPLSLRVKQRSLSLPVDVRVTKLTQSTSEAMRRSGFFRFEPNKLPGVEVIDLR